MQRTREQGAAGSTATVKIFNSVLPVKSTDSPFGDECLGVSAVALVSVLQTRSPIMYLITFTISGEYGF